MDVVVYFIVIMICVCFDVGGRKWLGATAAQEEEGTESTEQGGGWLRHGDGGQANTGSEVPDQGGTAGDRIDGIEARGNAICGESGEEIAVIINDETTEAGDIQIKFADKGQLAVSREERIRGSIETVSQRVDGEGGSKKRIDAKSENGR